MPDHDGVSGRSDGAGRARVDALIAAEPVLEADQGQLGSLRRLCRALAQDLAVMGVAVTVMSDAGSEFVAAGSDDRTERVEELQFSLGEGPCREAYLERRPVLVDDLGAATLRWPGYAPAAAAAGVGAAFAFPLGVGAAGLGVLDVYADRPGSLRDDQVAVALTFAEVATEALLELSASNGHIDASLYAAMDYRTDTYRAQGMVMIQLDVGVAEALVRMRAHAFAIGLDLTTLARAIVAGETRMDGDEL